MHELPEHLRRSITGIARSAVANWRDIHLQLGAPVYFCNPHSPWQRGSNGNTRPAHNAACRFPIVGSAAKLSR
jgi:transposase, IS30 family